MSKKYFINNLDTYIGDALFQEIRNDVTEDGEINEEANIMYGTYFEKDSSEKPQGIKKMLKRGKPRLAMKYISDCDVIIYDLHRGDPRDIELALGAFEKYKIEEEAEEKVLILISSVAVWKNTEPKLVEIKPEGEKKEGEGEGEGEKEEEKDPNEAEGDKDKEAEGDKVDEGEGNKEGEGEGAQGEGEEAQGEGDNEGDEEIPQVEYRNEPYTEVEYAIRNPPEDYEKIKEWEDRILELKKKGLKTYVVCSGIIYGNGEKLTAFKKEETVFNDKLKSAWLQDPEHLPYIEDGENRIPTIHVVDLARLVRKVYETKPEHQYIFAIDNTEDRRQKSIIQAISSGIGTGKTESKEYQVDDAVRFNSRLELTERPNSTLSIDLNLKPSPLMVQESNDEEAEPVEFPWHCEKGLAANIDKVKGEFCKVTNLNPIKIFITGPPLSGKTFFGEKLADHYNIPLINLKNLIPEIEAMEILEGEENELLTRIKNSEKPYSNELLCGMVRHRLEQNDCQHRGFVLDGFPRTYEDAKNLFYWAPKKKEKPKKPEGEGEGEEENADEGEEEEDEKKYKPKFQKHIYPESVIILEATDEFLMEKAKKLPSEVMKNSHYYDNHMNRRLAAWHQGNTIDDYRYGLEPGKPALTTARFFQEKETELLDIFAGIGIFELFESLRIYVERHGRPYNYLSPLDKLNNDRHIQLEQHENDSIKIKEERDLAEVQNKEKYETRLQKLAQDRLPQIKKHSEDLKKVKDLKTRDFLMKNIVPTLSEGLIEITKVAPIDPIDYLAEYIFNKSNDLHEHEA
ncbi:unnamed protein product [Moneuplotes crassus]|uniref:Adenylate kinase n=1 Tax=Euplotes crassus TaxID=5936 RepID=A0AAD2DBK0_EUPCR|nr:unnamed protein product [Moneuplotes crassus]